MSGWTKLECKKPDHAIQQKVFKLSQQLPLMVSSSRLFWWVHCSNLTGLDPDWIKSLVIWSKVWSQLAAYYLSLPKAVQALLKLASSKASNVQELSIYNNTSKELLLKHVKLTSLHFLNKHVTI